MALGIASSGQHGFDFKDGELRISVLRSSAYCHERGFDLDRPPEIKTGTPTQGAKANTGTRTSGTCPPSWKFADIGVHEFRLLVTAGAPASVKSMMPGLADYLAMPPAAHAHLPYDASLVPPAETLITVKPSSIRLLACKRSWDGQALVMRLQEAVGNRTKAELRIARPADKSKSQERGHAPEVHVPLNIPSLVPLSFAPFEIKTLRMEKNGSWGEVKLIEEEL